MKFVLLLIASSVAWGQANPTPPALPRSVPPSAQPPVTGSVVPVHGTGNVVTNGTNLQTAYNAASCGSQIVLDAGVEYRGSFVFNKQCSAANWIQVVSANLASIPISPYATQAQANNQNNAPAAPNTVNFAKLTSGSGSPVLGCTDSNNVPAMYNYFGGLEVTNTVGTILVFCLSGAETVASQLPDHIIFDRIYTHGIPASSTQFFTRGFFITGSNVSIVNSYVADIYSTGQDTQAILMADGPGPYLIHNNFLEGAAENILAGGTGKTPGYSCTVSSSPSPTTNTATVNTCVDAGGNSVSTPAVGTCVMFYTSLGKPAYIPDDWTCITSNASGALTFNAIPSAPLSGVGKVAWGLVPADITITGNVVYKPPTWNPANSGFDGITRDVKNLLETKYGVRWLIDGNIFQHVWNGGQGVGFNINATDQNGDCPWCVVQDVTMTNNIWQDIYQTGVIIPAQSYSGPAPGPLARVVIQNNLFWPEYSGTILGINGYIVNGVAPPVGTNNGADSVQIIHNHLLGPGQNMHAGGSIGEGMPQNYTNLVIKDNITEFDQYRWMNECIPGPQIDGTACINSSLNTGNTSAIATNAIINTGAVNGGQGVPDSTLAARYGSMILSTTVDSYSAAAFVNYSAINTDYHNFALAASSPFHSLASDGTDPGVNFAQLDSALGGSGLTCDLNHDGIYNVLDVQLMTNQVLGTAACTNDLDGSGTCNIIDVQRVVNAALGASCRTGP